MKKSREIIFSLMSLLIIVISRGISGTIGQFWSDFLICTVIIISTMTQGTLSCVVISFFSPFLVKFLGITDMPISLLSVIAISNIMVVTVYTVAFSVFASDSVYQRVFTWFVSILFSAFLKYEMLSVVVGKILLNILEINSAVTYSFGTTHFWTTVLSGLLCAFISEPVRKFMCR